MPTVAELTLAIAECLIMPKYGYGPQTSSTVVDNASEEPDALFNGGTIWILSGLNAGKMARIVTWDAATKTYTYTPTMTNPAASVQYAALDARYPTDALIGALNIALQELGPFDAIDETLTVADGEDRYTLPAGVSGIKRVQIATSSTEPYAWTAPHRWWKEHNGVLELSPYHLPGSIYTGNKIRLWYEAPHARIFNETDQVNGSVHPRRIAWQAAWAAARARNARGDTSDPQTKIVEELAGKQALQMQLKHPVRRLEKDVMWIDLP